MLEVGNETGGAPNNQVFVPNRWITFSEFCKILHQSSAIYFTFLHCITSDMSSENRYVSSQERPSEFKILRCSSTNLNWNAGV